MFQSRLIVVLIGMLLLPCCTFAQNNEVSISVAEISGQDQTVLAGIPARTPTEFALEGTLAHKLAGAGVVSLYIEAPLVVVPNRIVTAGFNPSTVSAHGRGLFFTPGLKVQFFGGSHRAALWFSAGGGVAHTSVDGNNLLTPSLSNTSGALQIGGGVDIKTRHLPLIFRAEVRDFWAESPLASQSFFRADPERQHNILGAIGLVFRF